MGIGNHNYFLTYLVLIWVYLVWLLIACVLSLNKVITVAEIVAAAEGRGFLFAAYGTWWVAASYRITLVATILLDLFFLAPLCLLLAIQTLNYLHAQTTSARLKMNTLKRVRSQSGLKIEELDGRGYAKEALLNYNDRMKLFVDRDTALRFSRDYSQ